MLTFVQGPPLLSAAAVRAAEAGAIAAGTSARLLMERAAAAAALAIRRFCPANDVLVLCGPGNNGGDGSGVAPGLAAAVAAAGVRVTVAADSLPVGDPAAALAAAWPGLIADDLPALLPAVLAAL